MKCLPPVTLTRPVPVLVAAVLAFLGPLAPAGSGRSPTDRPSRTVTVRQDAGLARSPQLELEKLRRQQAFLEDDVRMYEDEVTFYEGQVALDPKNLSARSALSTFRALLRQKRAQLASVRARIRALEQ